jgi:CHASE2 domain-containing sensor protein
MTFQNFKEAFVKKFSKYRLEIGACLVLLCGLFALSLFAFPDILENYFFDLRFKTRKTQEQHPDIVIIEIADDTLKKLKSGFPIKRGKYGELINALKNFGPRLIAFDMLFSEPSQSSTDYESFRKRLKESGGKYDDQKIITLYQSYLESGKLSQLDDMMFTSFMKRSGNVFLPYSFDMNKGRVDQQNFPLADGIDDIYPPFKEAAVGSGFINVSIREGIIRKIPLFIKYQGIMHRHIALNLALDVLGRKPDDIQITKNQIIIRGREPIPVDSNHRLTINWAGKWEETYAHYSFIDIINSYGQMLKGEAPLIDLNVFYDKICIVALTETGIADAKSVPIQDGVVPGVSIWLNAINTFLSENYIVEISPAITFLFSLLLMMLSVSFIRRYQPHTSVPMVAVILGLYVLVAFVLFKKADMWLNITRPISSAFFGVLISLSYNYLKLKNLMDLQLSFEQKLVMTAKTNVPMEKQRIGRYQILGEIGRGGMAIVFKGKEKETGKIAAIKVINPLYSADPTFKIRFKREAKVMMRIHHPNIIGIYELNRQKGVYYYAMEYFLGKDLKDKFSAIRKKGEKQVIHILRQILDGLQSVHKKDIVHRDIKPANILINDEGFIKITDFGLARPIEDDNLMTTIGQAVGTPAYCAPEQIMGKKVSARSDIYALGVLMYEMVNGTLPYKAANIADLARQKVTGDIKPFSDDSILSSDLEKIIGKMLIANPGKRYQSVDEILSDLDAYEEKKTRINNAETQIFETEE